MFRSWQWVVPGIRWLSWCPPWWPSEDQTRSRSGCGTPWWVEQCWSRECQQCSSLSLPTYKLTTYSYRVQPNLSTPTDIGKVVCVIMDSLSTKLEDKIENFLSFKNCNQNRELMYCQFRQVYLDFKLKSQNQNGACFVWMILYLLSVDISHYVCIVNLQCSISYEYTWLSHASWAQKVIASFEYI